MTLDELLEELKDRILQKTRDYEERVERYTDYETTNIPSGDIDYMKEKIVKLRMFYDLLEAL